MVSPGESAPAAGGAAWLPSPRGDGVSARTREDLRVEGPRPPPAATLIYVPLAVSNGDVILIVVFVVLPIAAIAFAGSGAVYREIGKGAFWMDHEQPSKGGGAITDAAGRAEQAEEVRQMLEAKAYRQAQRGEEPLDVEEEMAKLLAPAAPADLSADPGLVEEVRQLVVARNERRVRRGEEPLDVEDEIARQLRDLENL